jgi:iron complex transport system substrate-binding protein
VAPGRALRAAFLAAVLLAAAACGGDGDTSDDLDTEATPAATEPSGATTGSTTGTPDEPAVVGYPVTIEHAMGSTTVEARPERIVTLNVQWTDALVAMGEQPAAYVLSESTGETDPYPWQAGLLDDATRIDTAGTVPFEQIAALEPDLILVTFLATEESDFATLQEIAPTIGLLGDLQVDPWPAHVETLGTVLGEPERAEQVIAEVEGRIDEVAGELPGLSGATYTLANYVPGDGIYVIADPDDGASELFYRLGMEIDPEILALDEQAIGRVQISFEEIALLDADLVGMLLNGTDPASIIGLDDLSATQNDTLISFELADIVGLNTPTPISIPYLIDLMLPTLETVATA